MTRIVAQVILGWVVLSTLTQSVGVSRAANQYTVQQGNQLLKLGEEQNLTDHPQGLITARDALTLFQTANDDAGMAASYDLIGRCNLAMSNLPEAKGNYQLALQLWQKLNRPKEQAATLINLAFIEQRKADWPNALAYYNQAQVLNQNDPDQAGQIATGIGDMLNETGMPETALPQFQRALDSYREDGDPRAINNTLINIGNTKFLLGDYSGALTDLQTAVATAPKPVDAAWSHEDLGRVYIALREYELALQHLQPSLDIYQHSSNPTETERVRSLIAQAYEQQGKLDLARANYLQALNGFRRLRDRINEAAVSFRLGRLELKAGRLDDAQAYLKQSIDETEDLRTISLGREVTTAYSASVHDRYDAYITCLLRQSKQTSSPALREQALAASELSRGRALLELLRDTQTNLLAGVDPQLAEREKTLRQTIRAKMDYRAQLLTTKYDEKELSAVETKLDQLQQEHKHLSEQLRSLNPSYGELTEPTVYSLQQIQNEVLEDDQTALVEYILGDETSYVWVVTRNGMNVTELAGAAVITNAVQNAYTLLSVKPAGNDDRINKALEDLSALVLTPIANQLAARRLIVVADGALNYIPFQVLPLSDKQPLIATREVVNAPSASILGQLRREKLRRAAPDNVVAAFGYPAFASNYAELKGAKPGDVIAQARNDETQPWSYALRDIEINGDSLNASTIQPLIHTRTELADLREVAGPASFFATGFNASRETLEHTDLSKFAIVHFATHGFLDPRRPEKSGFLLSTVGADGQEEKGFITIQDVYALHAPVSLVVLSACRTGLGKDVRGEGLISMTRGFMYAGASSIAATLWNVDDEVTSQLMKEFYTKMLQQGLTPAAALREAQNSIRQQPQWRSPHYWAAFTFQGEYREPARLPQPKNSMLSVYVILVGVVLILLCGVAWWYWRRRHSTRKT
jgi:CHAT domain-containing protein